MSYPTRDDIEHTELELKEAQEEAWVLVNQVNEKVAKIWEKMTVEHRDVKKRKAKQLLTRAKHTYEQIQRYLDQSESVIALNTLQTENNQQTGLDIDGFEPDDPVPIKTVQRWWQRLLQIISEFFKEDVALMFAPVRQFLTQFASSRDSIESRLMEKQDAIVVEDALVSCEKRLKRLEDTIKRKNPKLAKSAKERFDKEWDKLSRHTDHPEVAKFWSKAAITLSQYESVFLANAENYEQERRARLEAVKDNVRKMQMDVRKANAILDARMEAELEKLKHEANEVIEKVEDAKK